MILKIAEKNKDLQTAETTANKIIELEEFAKWRIKQIPDTTPEEHLKSEMKQYNIIMYRDWETDRKSTRLNSSHSAKSRMPSSA